ncbi:hypothetical protein [Sphingomonas colocasiae]|uniref:Uncharacterized protein n=1 Tax=Sphingomonas colocasiae TaxID=1848973 RepID=A0ABS7PRG5_9SPHN|nr:hypothetical protein [Sphingomonas colocasiae]MBY8823260.1 hypothetical protein [Sphingomonas colocasiae]
MATLNDVFVTLFPDRPAGKDPFAQAPFMPTDIFAYVAHLLERSGAYHHIVPEVPSEPHCPYRRIVVDDAMRARARDLGRTWRRSPIPPGRLLPPVPGTVEALWLDLGQFRDVPVFVQLNDRAEAPGWWARCLELMMICDEACEDIGFDTGNPFFAMVSEPYREGEGFERVQHGPFSLSSAAEDLLCVQAKSRTPSVGCTPRSLSHHLALLPPRGQVRARWVDPLFADGAKVEERQLGLLLVPFPYRVNDEAFRPAGIDPGDHFGWFTVEQTWLPLNDDKYRRGLLVDFVLGLVAEARAKGARVDGVVLPELALNFEQFSSLARALAKDAEIDFLVSGISSDKSKREGNFVAIMPFFLLGAERDPEITGWEGLILIREKHHRWKIDARQIKDYNLVGLNRRRNWWEQLTILRRSLDLLVYRGNTTLTTLICEDLARVDPCQAVVRGVGPNLLIALLMDGPQIRDRWPARYATVLAEDPGTSVLSLTSFGLIARQNDVGEFPESRSVALWKDEKSGVCVLDLPAENDAIVLELEAVDKEERTLDGRRDHGSAIRWQYGRHLPIAGRKVPEWIRSGTAPQKSSSDQDAR